MAKLFFTRNFLTILAISFALLGCATQIPASYSMKVPTLTVRPEVTKCSYVEQGETKSADCVTMLLSDFNRFVVELEGACFYVNAAQPKEIVQERCGFTPTKDK